MSEQGREIEKKKPRKLYQGPNLMYASCHKHFDGRRDIKA